MAVEGHRAWRTVYVTSGASSRHAAAARRFRDAGTEYRWANTGGTSTRTSLMWLGRLLPGWTGEGQPRLGWPSVMAAN